MEKIYKNKIFKILMAMYSFICVCYQMSLFKTSIQYSSLLLLFFGSIVYLYIKYPIQIANREKKYSITLSILSSTILVIGKIVFENVYINNVYLFNLFNLLISFFCIVGIFILFYHLYAILFKNINKINIYSKEYKKYSFKNVFIFNFIIIFLCYLPYFLRCYPAMMSPDSFVQINTVEQHILTNIHPFIQTWFFGGIYLLGKILFGVGNPALAFYIIIQMLLISSVFSFAITLMYKYNINKKICLLFLLMFALSPLHAFYSVTLWKDILFGVNFVLILISLLKLNENVNIKNIFLFVFSILIMFFFRNNGIYVFIIMTPFLILNYKQNKKLFATLSVGLICFYFIIIGPVYRYFNVASTSSVEAYSIPLQQIARVITLNGNISNNDKTYLNSIMNYDLVSEKYQPFISDNIKNNVYLNEFNNSKKQFFKTYLNLMIHNPRIYFESYLSSTVGYWYPDSIYHATSILNCETELYNAFDYGISNQPIINGNFGTIMDYTMSKGYPFSSLVWSVGLYCNLLFISFVLTLYNRKTNNNLICYTPFIGLWFTMMLAAPVFCELRYVYGLFTCMPFIMLLPFINNKEKNLKGVVK